MRLDEFLGQAVELVRIENEKKSPRPQCPASFTVIKKAEDLIKSCDEQSSYHSTRELHYTGELEKAEKILKEQGLSLEVIDPKTGAVTGVTSGAINTNLTTDFTNFSVMPGSALNERFSGL